jgi:hypothetical protein
VGVLLISSGMVQSKERRPALTSVTLICNLNAARALETIEFVYP